MCIGLIEVADFLTCADEVDFAGRRVVATLIGERRIAIYSSVARPRWSEYAELPSYFAEALHLLPE